MTYSHRNGETEPPTKGGWYWFKGTRPDGFVSMGIPLVFVHRDGRWRQAKARLDPDKYAPISEFRGRWWGPLSLPWEDNA